MRTEDAAARSRRQGREARPHTPREDTPPATRFDALAAWRIFQGFSLEYMAFSIGHATASIP